MQSLMVFFMHEKLSEFQRFFCFTTAESSRLQNSSLLPANEKVILLSATHVKPHSPPAFVTANPQSPGRHQTLQSLLRIRSIREYGVLRGRDHWIMHRLPFKHLKGL